MNDDAKKSALRMIPYGLYVMTARSRDGATVSAATVNWVTQAAFAPPLVVVGVKKDSGGHALVKEAGAFALNILGKGQAPLAYDFFKPTALQGDRLNGHAFRLGVTGSPLLEAVPAWIECRLVETAGRPFALRRRARRGGHQRALRGPPRRGEPVAQGAGAQGLLRWVTRRSWEFELRKKDVFRPKTKAVLRRGLRVGSPVP